MLGNTISACSFRDLIKGKKYILVRRLKSKSEDKVVVNVMEVVSRPRFCQETQAILFIARGISINGRDLNEIEGEQIELSIDEIGCPRHGDFSGIPCRTFRFSEDLHQLLLRDVLRSQDQWKFGFAGSRCDLTPEHDPAMILMTTLTSTSVGALFQK